MTYKLRYISIGFIMSAIFVTSLSLFYVAKANPSYFIRSNSATSCTPTASTSVAYMTTGNATTTYAFDTGCLAAGSVDSAALAIQMNASSTVTVLNVNLEYSQDGLDWYADQVSLAATSTLPIAISTSNSYQWKFASSTIGGAAAGQAGINGTNNRDSKIIAIKTPTKYVRAVLTVTGANAAVWAEFISKRQNP